MSKQRLKMTVDLEVTPAQALALQCMFEHWNALASMGSSRRIGFFVDGDGNFKPKCKFTYSETLPELTDEMRRFSVSEEQNGNRLYDYDDIAWLLNSKK